MARIMEPFRGLAEFFIKNDVVYAPIKVDDTPQLVPIAELNANKFAPETVLQMLWINWHQKLRTTTMPVTKMETFLTGSRPTGLTVINVAEGLLVAKTRNFIAAFDYRLPHWRLKYIGDGAYCDPKYVAVSNPAPDKVICLGFDGEGYMNRVFIDNESPPRASLKFMPINVWQSKANGNGKSTRLFYQRCNNVLYASVDGVHYEFKWEGNYFIQVNGDPNKKFRMEGCTGLA